MKNLSNIFKQSVALSTLIFAGPVLADSSFTQVNAANGSATVHKVAHGLAKTVNYQTTSGYKWGNAGATDTAAPTKWADAEAEATSYKWAMRENINTQGPTEVQSASTSLEFTWGNSSVASETGYKWGFRSYADQAGYKWGFRSYADQAGYKWGFRSYADQAGYKWGFRSYADQTGYKWSLR
tara:strand:- start:50040 stop:50585 length:546 start_codon:yes stop_codon:yes gene_type:complete